MKRRKGLRDWMINHTLVLRQGRSRLKSPMRFAKSKKIRSLGNGECTPRFSRKALSSPRAHVDASWQKIAPSMDGTSPKARLSPRKRCPSKPLGGTNIGVSIYDISSTTNFRILKVQSMSLVFWRIFRECCWHLLSRKGKT